MMINFCLAIKKIAYDRVDLINNSHPNIMDILCSISGGVFIDITDKGYYYTGATSIQSLYDCLQLIKSSYKEEDYYFCAPFGVDNFEFGKWYDNPFGFKEYYIECTVSSIVDDYLMDNEYIEDYMNNL